MPSPPAWNFTAMPRNDSNDLAPPRRDEFRAVVARRQPRCELESKFRDLADAACIDLFPVVAGAVIVRVKAGEEVDGRHPPGDERRIVAATGARTLAPHAQLIAA